MRTNHYIQPGALVVIRDDDPHYADDEIPIWEVLEIDQHSKNRISRFQCNNPIWIETGDLAFIISIFEGMAYVQTRVGHEPDDIVFGWVDLKFLYPLSGLKNT
jgi:hypothetical protein